MFGSAVLNSVRRGQARIALSSAESGRTKLRHGSWSQAGDVDNVRCCSSSGHKLSQGHQWSEASCYVVLMRAMQRDEGRNSRSRRSILTKVVSSSTILNMMKLTSYRFVTSRAGLVLTLERGLGRKRGVGVLESVRISSVGQSGNQSEWRGVFVKPLLPGVVTDGR